MCTELTKCDGRCGKPKVHYTMGHRAQAERFERLKSDLHVVLVNQQSLSAQMAQNREALEERLQRIELLMARLLEREHAL